ncbi:hypothetical protein ERO13_D11G249550v2 [Gossypium hirsutum]|uniref:Uncharacterized protein n=5 Tax=Gossypium TaxID=3633 RepID=A0A0D2SKE9_GOSRA|nr:U-box domain-containing protein 9-like [Gossypium hirsutum]KAB2005451.1 hypothetical protein ES319_D11G270800v1 [Gossypium barbadense]KJB44699.1 hypothetical protein B456_007G267300 [Gossypium raimondii]TYG46793.1 hypothetical protein ES288_D11G284800v1 [Gossypium darwinii]TYH45749.1 hypothetical protein ES332_D11G287300v1 [Gossypium tomentosum]KAG4122168.1 hypothetical protein ERO13_D11G249550v2 [Gossypium hirsutum]
MAEKGDSSATGAETTSMAEKETPSMTEKQASSATGEETSSMAEKETSSMAAERKSSAVGEETDLEKVVERVVTTIPEDDATYKIDIMNESRRLLSLLKEMKLNQTVGLGRGDGDRAFLDEQLVILGSGQNWLNDGNLKCAMVDRVLVELLLEKLSSSLPDQNEAAKDLQMLTKAKPSCREAFSKLNGAISRLLSPLSLTKVESNPELQEDLITTVLNILTDDRNKHLVGEHPRAIPLLTESMKYGTDETRRNAIAALVSLSALDLNKFIIGSSGALAPLLEVMCVGHPLAIKEAASAIRSLCKVYENQDKFTKLGAVKIILQKIKEGILVDELLGVLAVLSTHNDAVEELGDPDTFHYLIDIKRNTASEIARKKCIEILFNVSMLEKPSFGDEKKKSRRLV